VPVLVAVVLAVFGQAFRASVVLGFAVLAAIAIAAGLPLSAWVERGAKAIGHALSTAAGALVFLVVIGPAWTWTRLARRDPFGRSRASSNWADRAGAPARDAALGSPTHQRAGRRSLVGRLTWSVGCVIVLLSLNYGAGWAVDQVVDHPGPASFARSGEAPPTVPPVPGEATSTTVAPAPKTDVAYDPRVRSPALRDAPWAEEYLADIQRTPINSWPYTQYRPLPFTSKYVNIDGWTRRTYRTPGPSKGRPTVWMFGGSTAWGEGQRDEGTIASWLARLAERDGLPIEISNLGQRGWTHFQEMVLYEQLLGLDEKPDLALFYDGVNEINTQSLVPEAVPSHYGITEDKEANDGKTFATRFGESTPSNRELLADVWYAYSEHSLIHKVANWFSSRADARPATPTAADRPAPVAQAVPVEIDPTLQDGRDAGAVYERIKQLTLSLSDRYDVPSLLYWQPFKSVGDIEQAATDQITPPTIDISTLLLDHQDVFIDGAHTNEEGARIVAERIWKDLRPAVQTWHEEHP